MSRRAYRLKSDEGVADGLRRIAAGRAEIAMERLAGAGEESIGAAIHGARKDLKKLRAVLRLLRENLGREAFKAESRRYREAGRLLAGSRDADVKLGTLRALRDRSGALPSRATLLWEQALERDRDEIAAADGIDLADALDLIARGRDRIGGWKLGEDRWKLLEPGLITTYRQGRQAMRRAASDRTADHVHRWRKRAKDHWYELRIVRAAWPPPLDATIDQVHALTELLGDHHDLALLGEDLRVRPELDDREPFAAAIAARQEELLESAIELGRRIYAEKPKAFGRRLEAYWLAWRGP